MQENFRQFLDRLRQTGELVDLHQPVDIRHIATLVDQSATALYFQGDRLRHRSCRLIRTASGKMMAMGCRPVRDRGQAHAGHQPADPAEIRHISPTRKVVLMGDDIDSTSWILCRRSRRRADDHRRRGDARDPSSASTAASTASS
jgi:2,5-furandicarboxylate decarboxylase 1